MNARRILLITAVSVACAWMALVLAYGGLHFDDFVSISESRGALSLTAGEWMKPASDGRWQPLKRLTFDALARAAGLTFWPYALALAGAHLLMAAGAWSAARAIFRDGESALYGGLIALASLNLSAYSIANAGSLQGILCIALSVWSVALALHAASLPRGRTLWLTLSALSTLAACWYKESAVTTPALAWYGAWLASRARPFHFSEALRSVAAPAAGVALYLAVRLAFDVRLIPADSRYALGGSPAVARNALFLAANVLPWAVVAAVAAGAFRERARGALADLAIMIAAAVAVALPSLLLPWTSPNFWYAAVPVASLGTASVLHRTPRPARAAAALALTMVLALGGVSAAAFAAGFHRWGPYSEASVQQFLTFPRHGGRIVWFDRDSHAGYGGLVRTVGPGMRLTHALRLATGDESLEAATCISVLVAPLYVQGPGDELYMHSAGRLEPIATPPPGLWYCLE
ncbi:MAG: hypothetical protein M3Q55_01330 [Acidobacteriota bacterium]|nr:hypothetical protein [Acidobacteriota bacterium]